MWCQKWDPVTMAQGRNRQNRPTPGEMMKYLERSMTEVDQMMEQLRASMSQESVADSEPGRQEAFLPTLSGQSASGPTADSQMPAAQQVRFGSTPREQSRRLPTAGTGVHITPPLFSPPMHDVGRANDALIGRRPHMVPDRFDGHTPVEDYLHHFEACAGVNRWTKVEAVQFLAASLRGSSVKLLTQQPGVDLTYDELVYRLRNRFGLGGKAEVYLAELRQRHRQPKESLQELGQTIRELCALSYPEFDEKGQDRLARGHFLDAVVTPEIREGLFRAQPRTLDDAVEAALNTEAFLRMEGQRNEVKRSTTYSRALEECEVSAIREQQPRNPTIDEIVKKVLDALDMRNGRNTIKPDVPDRRPEQTMPTKVSEREDNRCFNCNELGHWRNQCPYPRKVRGGTAPPAAEKANTNLQWATANGMTDEEEQTRVGSSQDFNRKGLFLEGKINGQPLKLLIDTGATNTLISDKVFDQIEDNRRPELLPVTSVVLQADGTPLRTRGTSRLEVQIGDSLVTTMVTVASLKNEGILGLDFLVQINAVLDCQKMELRTEWGIIPCLDSEGESFCRRIVAGKEYSIPPGHEIVLADRVTGKKVALCEGLVESPVNPTELWKKGPIVARSVVKADEDVLPVRVFNPTKEQRIIKAGTAIASLSALEKVGTEMCNQTMPTETSTSRNMPSDKQRNKDVDARRTTTHFFQCDSCTKSYEKKDSLQRHKREVHIRKYHCGQCNYRTGRKTEMERHQGAHDVAVVPVRKHSLTPVSSPRCKPTSTPITGTSEKADASWRHVRMDWRSPPRDDPRLDRPRGRSPRRYRSSRRKSKSPQRDLTKSSCQKTPESPQHDGSEASPRHSRQSTPEPEEELDNDERSPSPLDLRYSSRKMASETAWASEWTEIASKNAETQTDTDSSR